MSYTILKEIKKKISSLLICTLIISSFTNPIYAEEVLPDSYEGEVNNIEDDISVDSLTTDIQLSSMEDTKENKEVTVSNDFVWNMLSYTGKESLPLKAFNGKYYCVKGIKFYVGKDGKSSDKKALKINKKGIAKVGKGKNVSLTSPFYGDTEINIISPKLKEKKAKLRVGDATNINITGIPEGLPVDYISSDPNIAEVYNGKVIATGIGKCKIFISICGKTYKFNVTVKDSPNSTLLYNVHNGKKPFKVKGLKKKSTLNVSNDSISVEKNTIKISSTDKMPIYGDISDGHKVCIYMNDITPVSKDFNLKIGEKAYVFSDNCHEFPNLKSKNPYIAAISEYGVLIGTAPGKTVIKGKFRGEKIKINVNVSDEIYKGEGLPYRKLTVIDPINYNKEEIVELGNIPAEPVGKEYVTVSFDSLDGTDIKSETIEKGTCVKKPSNPKKEGYDFVTWNLNDKEYDFNTPVLNDIILKAVYIKTEPNNVNYVIRSIFMNTSGEYPENGEGVEIQDKEGKPGETVSPIPAEHEGFITPKRKSIILNDSDNVIEYKYERKTYPVVLSHDNNISETKIITPAIKNNEYYYGQKIEILASEKDSYTEENYNTDDNYRYKNTHSYSFDKWVDKNNNKQSDNNSITITVPIGGIELKAEGNEDIIKTDEEYKVNIEKGDNINSISGVPENEWCRKGSVIILQATLSSNNIENDYTVDPDNIDHRYKINHTFDLEWNDGDNNENKTVTVDKPYNLKAEGRETTEKVNEQYMFSLNAVGGNFDSFSVSSNNGWHDKDSTVSITVNPKADYTEGSYTLNPEDNNHRYKVSHKYSLMWNDGNTTNHRQFKMDKPYNMTVSVNEETSFINDQYKLTINKGDNINSITPLQNNGWYDKNSSVNISVVPKAKVKSENFEIDAHNSNHKMKKEHDYKVRWNDNYTSNDRTIVMDKSYTFDISANEIISDTDDEYYLTINKGSYIDSVSNVNGWYRKDSIVTISANANSEDIENDYTYNNLTENISDYRYKVTHTYLFDKWSDNNSDNPRDLTINKDYNLTAIGKVNEVTGKSNEQYKLIVNKDNGVLSTSPVNNCWYNKDAEATVTAVYKPGYKENNGTGTYTMDTAKTVNISSVPVTYTISYNMSSKCISGNNPDNYNIESDLITLENPSMTGYIFNGWTGTDLTGTVNPVTIPSGSIGNREYSAEFSPITYKVRFNGNNNTSGSMSDEVFTYDAHDNLTDNGFIKDGYTFTGWSVSPNEVKVYDNGEDIFNLTTINNDIINLYALWTPNTNTPYIINHYKQRIDGTYSLVPDDTENKEGTTDTTVSVNTMDYEGFTAPENVTGVIKGDGSAVINVYYTRKTYTVTISKNDCVNSVEGAGEYLLGKPVIVKFNYSEGELEDSVSANVSLSLYDKDTYIFAMPAENVVIDVKGKKITYKVIYDMNRAISGNTPVSQNKIYGEDLTLAGNEGNLNRGTKYEFVGWNTKKNGYGTHYNAGEVYTENAPLYLYAQWHSLDEAYLIQAGANQRSGVGQKYQGTDLSLHDIFAKHPDAVAVLEYQGDEDDIQDKLVNDNLISTTKDSSGKIYNGKVWTWYDEDENVWYYYSDAGRIYLNSNSTDIFKGFGNIKSIDISTFDGSKATNLKSMFHDCVSLNNVDLSGFNTSHNTTMRNMFHNCKSIKHVDLTSLDTSNVTDMSEMFEDCENLESVDFSGLDLSNVTLMYGMFNNCRKLKELDMTNFNMNNVDICGAFRNCESLTTIYVSDNPVKKHVVHSNYTPDEIKNEGKVFENCVSINGMSGTTYDPNHISYDYAKIDIKDTAKGYLSMKTNGNICIVRHYLEELDGTYPTIPTDTDYIDVISASITPPCRTYEGFTSPVLQTKNIIDAVTIVSYYYTRNTYNLTVNKGDNIESVAVTPGNNQAVKYGENIKIVAYRTEDKISNEYITEGGYRYKVKEKEYIWNELSGYDTSQLSGYRAACQKMTMFEKSNDRIYYFTMPASDLTLTISAVETVPDTTIKCNEQYYLTVNKDDGVATATDSQWVNKGSSIKITATPKSNRYIISGSGYTETMNEPKTVNITTGIIDYPGMYNNGFISWENLIANNYIKVTENDLYRGTNYNNLTGTLIIDNKIKILHVSGSTGALEGTKITSVTIPASVTQIGNYAFWNCTNLSTINYLGTITQWKAISKGNSPFYSVPATLVHCIDGDTSLK